MCAFPSRNRSIAFLKISILFVGIDQVSANCFATVAKFSQSSATASRHLRRFGFPVPPPRDGSGNSNRGPTTFFPLSYGAGLEGPINLRVHTAPPLSANLRATPDYTVGEPIQFGPRLNASSSAGETPLLHPDPTNDGVEGGFGQMLMSSPQNSQASPSRNATQLPAWLELKVRPVVVDYSLVMGGVLWALIYGPLVVAEYQIESDEEQNELEHRRKIQAIQAQTFARRIKALQQLGEATLISITENKLDAENKLAALNKEFENLKGDLATAKLDFRDSISDLQKILSESVAKLAASQKEEAEERRALIDGLRRESAETLAQLTEKVAANKEEARVLLQEITKQLTALNSNYEHLDRFVHSSRLRQLAISWIFENRSPDIKSLVDYLVELRSAEAQAPSLEELSAKLSSQLESLKSLTNLRDRWLSFKQSGWTLFSSSDNDTQLLNFIVAASSSGDRDFFIYNFAGQRILAWLEEDIGIDDGSIRKRLLGFDPMEATPTVMSFGYLDALLNQEPKPSLVSAADWALIYSLSSLDPQAKADLKIGELLNRYREQSETRGISKAQILKKAL